MSDSPDSGAGLALAGAEPAGDAEPAGTGPDAEAAATARARAMAAKLAAIRD